MATFKENNYDLGYNKGYRDGQMVSPVDYHFKIITGNSYNDGYATGYNQGFREKQNTQKTQSVKSTNNYSNNIQGSMAEMNLEVQKQRISDLKTQLDLMVGRVEYMKQDLNGQLDRALENGLPLEVYQRYKAHYLSSLYNGLDVLTNRVMRDDMGYLNDVQVHIQEAINRR